MARIQKTIRLDGNDRDTGKVFIITEMAPRDGHKWATRALFALLNAGLEMPDDMANSGLAGLAAMGMSALGKVPVELAEPLLEDLLSCVVVVPDPTRPNLTRADIERDIEEIKTFFTLQMEVLKVHLEPFTSGGLSSGTQPQEVPRVG